MQPGPFSSAIHYYNTIACLLHSVETVNWKCKLFIKFPSPNFLTISLLPSQSCQFKLRSPYSHIHPLFSRRRIISAFAVCSIFSWSHFHETCSHRVSIMEIPDSLFFPNPLKLFFKNHSNSFPRHHLQVRITPLSAVIWSFSSWETKLLELHLPPLFPAP